MRVPTNTFYRQEALRFNEQWDKMSNALRQANDKLRLQYDSDDPVLAVDVNTTMNYIDTLTNYGLNTTLADNRVQTYDNTMKNVIGAVMQLSSLTTQAATQTIDDDARSAISIQINSILQQILGAANTQDGTGQYIYSGYNTGSPAYLLQSDGQYHYQGSYDTSMINIGLNAQIVYGDSGFNVFGDIPTGNGTFTVAPNPANTGSVQVSAGNLNNAAPYVKDDYTVTFTRVAGVDYYQLDGAVSGSVIPPTVYTDGATITANGMSFSMKGVPNPGDSFSVNPSTKANVFDTMTKLVDLLKTPIGSDAASFAKYSTNLNQLVASMDQAFTHFTSYQSTVGTRGQQIATQYESNLSLTNIQKNIWTQTATVPDYESISNMKAQENALQMTNSIYAELQRTLANILSKYV